MPISAETLRLLMDAGVEGDDLLRIVASIDADNQPKTRSSNAERQARFRARRNAEGVTNNVISNVTESVTPRTHVEANPQTNNSSADQTRKKTARDDMADFRAELSSILDAGRVDALVAVRRKKAATMTGNTGRLLVTAIQRCHLPPEEVADEMALRNWTGVKPEWLDRKAPNATAPPPAKPKSIGEMFREDARQEGIIPHEQPTSTADRRLGQGDRPREIGGAGVSRSFAVSGDLLGRIG